ncbi:hypothetical protein IGS67_09790 [Flavimobilis sp. GY10621]|uniref:Uncharacterized protein n=1 Tax=Flavimobilis rhizosphaerae TaxID=2775421 RepID=A0ABR9DRN3_9MICO|nr:hypothetical protein [Flavimobilis rhizosphaerae]MBD9699780.1 hypothetical protein [Flavimobilis rhizosphaerae]
MSARRAFGTLAGLVVGAVSTRVSRSVLDGAAADLDPETWTRTNYAGRRVDLKAGPALAAGLADAALAAGVVGGTPRTGVAHAVATLGAGAAGLNDDLREAPEDRRKGLRGHLGALREGRVTTGAVKIAGIGASAFVAALVVDGGRGPRSVGRRTLDVLVDTALVAGAANLVNLLDLRPGRALKAGAATSVALTLAGQGLAAAPALGPIATAVTADLEEDDMLGDCGANALGAHLGVAATGAPLPARAALLAGIVGLTLASERVSFSAVIDRTPALAAVDAWGRRR